MVKYIRVLVLLILLFLSAKAYPKTPLFPCMDAKDLMKSNMIFGYAYSASAIENNTFVIQFYINVTNNDWIIMAIDENGKACNILSGVDWQYIRFVKM